MGREQVSYTVEQLVALNPYNPDILPDLENHVNEQVRRPDERINRPAGRVFAAGLGFYGRGGGRIGSN